MHSAFQHSQYLLKRQVLALTGKLRVYDPFGNLVLYSQQKMFRLKEDIRVYSDETRSQELLHIQARQAIDFSASYDVYDSLSAEPVGALRRKGFRSLARDTWDVFDAAGQALGVLQEDDLALAMLRRVLLGNLLPQNYDLLIGGQRVADLRQRFNPFRYEMDLDFREDSANRLDRRLGIAAALLLGVIEGRQDS
ncbi:MAG: hypothetical protein JXA78_19205 [Anaerolineales bacterium]|nr:hypothetical protein [Anaerolineales bacterium]